MKSLPPPQPSAHPLWQRMRTLGQALCAMFMVILCTAGGSATAQSSSACDMTSFTWNGYVGDIIEWPDEVYGDYGTVDVYVPYGTNLSAVSPTIAVSPGATVNPLSGVEVDARVPLLYTVTAQDNVTYKEYDVNFIEAYSEAKMLSLSFGGTPITPPAPVNGVSFVTVTMPSGTNLTNLAPTYTLSPGATCTPLSNTTQDFTNAVEYMVYSADGFVSNTYVVMVTVNDPIFVNSGGSGTLTFSKNPPTGSWSTMSFSGAAGDITSEAAMDTAMSSIAGSSINTALANYAGAAMGTAYWRLDQLKLGTQPTGNKMTLLKSSLKNTSGGTVGGLAVSYQLGALNTPAEQINGHRVYWSLSGNSGTWTPAGTYLKTSSGTTTVNFKIEFPTGWANNGNLYVVWADDNGTGTQGSFTLDQVSFTPIPPAANFLSFGLPNNPGNFSNNEITLYVPFNTNVSALAPTYTMSYGATCNKASGSTQNFSSPVQYTVTSSDNLVTRVYTVTVVVATSYWTYGPWTNDANSGIDGAYPYTVAVNFGGSAVTVNGVPFQASATSGPNFLIGGNITNYNNDGNNVTGIGSALAKDFIYNGTPRIVTLSNLTPGATYETSFFSVGWENAGRVQDFASGGEVLKLDQDLYLDNNGIWIAHTFVATASTRSFTITPNSGGTFHMYAMANRLVAGANTLFTTTQLVSSKNPSFVGDSVTFTATVKVNGVTEPSATGNYAFRVNGNIAAIVPISSGTATYTTSALAPGSHAITASYSGSSSFRSSSASLTQSNVTPVILTVNSGGGDGSYAPGQVVPIIADLPAQNKAFAGWVINSGSPTIADMNSASTTLTMPATNVTITATYKNVPPAGITALAWYDASDAATIVEIGSPAKVSEWRDKSGNGYHATQSSSTFRPTKETGGLRFGGADVHLNLPVMAADAYTVMMVLKNDTALGSGSAPQMPLSLQAFAAGPAFGSSGSQLALEVVAMLDSSAAFYYTDRQGASNVNIPSVAAAPHLYSFVLSADWHIGMDGSADLRNLSSGVRHPMLFSQKAGGIGANVRQKTTATSAVEQEWVGLISEIILVPSAITQAQRQHIEGYFAWKWDAINTNNVLVTALPANHPYKTYAPGTNSPPVAIAQSVTATAATAKPITLTGSDADPNTTLSFAIVTQPSHGQLTGTPPNMTYTPVFGYSGADSFTFKVNDGKVDSVPAAVTITVEEGDPYAQWVILNGYTLTGGLTGDDDGDGMRNFDEFAFGLNPTSGASANPIVTPLNKATHSFSYTRYAYSELTYTVWTSTDLQNWGQTPVPVTEVVSQPNAKGVVIVQATLNAPPLQSTNFFLRVKAD